MKINKLVVSKFINFLLISLKEFVQSAYRKLSTDQKQGSIYTVAELERSDEANSQIFTGRFWGDFFFSVLFKMASFSILD